MRGAAPQSKGDQAPRFLAPAGQEPPLTGVDDGVHLQLGDIASEQGDLLDEMLVLLVLGLLPLRGRPWNKQGLIVGSQEGPQGQATHQGPQARHLRQLPPSSLVS